MKYFWILIGILLYNVTLFAQEVENKQQLHEANYIYHKELEKKKPAGLENYDVKHYLLDIEVSPYNTKIKGKARIKALAKKDSLDTIILELIDSMEVDSVHFNQQRRNFNHQNGIVSIFLPEGIEKESLFTVTVFYGGVSVGGRGVTSAYNSKYEVNVTWTLSESFHAKEWWPTKEILTDKADSATILLTTDPEYTAVSNGVLVKKENIGNNKVRYHWKTEYPINYYLVSFAVSDYQEYSFNAPVNKKGDSVKVQNFLYDSEAFLEENKEKIDATASLIEIFSDLFGVYPYSKEKYGHAISELGGGMEHQTITTIGNFSFLLVAHELAHQWFGDYVTCSSWQDIWINEGFASYGEYLALEFSGRKKEARDWMKDAHRLAFEEPNGSVYVPFEDINNESRIFNFYLSYKKGAAIIHMVRYIIDDDSLFFSLLRGFLEKYKHGNASGEDFLNYLNNNTDENLNTFFDDWYYGKGYPHYEVNWAREHDSLDIELSQTRSSGESNIFEIPVELRIEAKEKDTLITVYPKSAQEHIHIPFNYTVEDIIVDPTNWILNTDANFTDVQPTRVTQEKAKVYPNPFNSLIKIEFEQSYPSDRLINIRRIDGTTIFSKSFSGKKITIQTVSWPDGIYLLEIVENKSHLCKKIIKY